MKKLCSFLLVLTLLLAINKPSAASDWVVVINDPKDTRCSADIKSVAVKDDGNAWIIRIESWGNWELLNCDISLLFLYINLSGSTNKEHSDYSIMFMDFGSVLVPVVTPLKDGATFSVESNFSPSAASGTIKINKKDLGAKNARFSLLALIANLNGIVDAAPNSQQMALYSSRSEQPKARLDVSKQLFNFGLLPRNTQISDSFELINEGVGSLNVQINGPTFLNLNPRNIVLSDFETKKVTLTFDTKFLQAKAYDETIKVSSGEVVFEIRVLFVVLPEPKLKINREHIDFGILYGNQQKNEQFIVTNEFQGNIKGNITTDQRWIVVDKRSFDGNSIPINVSVQTRYLPSGPQQGTITIDSDGGKETIRVRAQQISSFELSKTHLDFGIFDADQAPDLNQKLQIINHMDSEIKISIIPKANWIAVSSTSLNIAPKSSGEIVVSLNPQHFSKVDTIYEADLLVESRFDSYSCKITVNYTQEAPKLEWLSAIADQKNVEVTISKGATHEELIVLKNSGSGMLDIASSVTDTKRQFRLFNSSFSLKRHETDEIRVRFSAETLDAGVYSTTLKITSNGGNLSIPFRIKVVEKEKVHIKLYIGKSTAYINDQSVVLDAPPYIDSGTTMVPLRFIGEAFRAQVEWVPLGLGRIMLRFPKKTIQLDIGIKLAYIDGKEYSLPVAPAIRNGRTYVPVRFISEGLGASISWNAALQEVAISYELDE